VSYLLDTNVVSEIRRGRDANAAAWAAGVADHELYLSVLTLGEVRKGIERLRGRDPKQADVFSDWLSELRERFADRLLAIDDRVADEWGRLNAPADRNTIDSLIAATARVYELTVVTRNPTDFDGCDVSLLDPFEHHASPPGDATRDGSSPSASGVRHEELS
jgi:predicted nucleic acid-binding protein